jgi:hypothetical protein
MEGNKGVLEMGRVLDALRNKKYGKNLKFGCGKNLLRATMPQ